MLLLRDDDEEELPLLRVDDDDEDEDDELLLSPLLSITPEATLDLLSEELLEEDLPLLDDAAASLITLSNGRYNILLLDSESIITLLVFSRISPMVVR